MYYLHGYYFGFLEVMSKIIKLIGNYGPEPFRVWLGSFVFGVVIIKPEDLQVIDFIYTIKIFEIN